jgi:hypothetical protein
MADVSEGSFAGRTAERAGVMARYAGTILSVGLVAGVGVWGYKLFVRDVTGIPVVRAMEGPMRVAPADPGGEIAMNTGLSVNAVVALGEAAPPEDILLLAPASNGLAPEDLEVQSTAEAGEVLAADVAPADQTLDRLGREVVTPVALATDAQPAVTGVAALPDSPMTPDQVLALADQIAAGTTPLTALAEGTETPVALSLDGQVQDPALAAATAAAADPLLAAPAVAPASEIVVIAASVPGVAVALRPPARPASATALSAVPEVSSSAAALVNTATIPPGTVMVQLGAYDTPEIAAGAWDSLSGRFAEFIAGKERVIQTATSNGVSFFRLRAMGFANRDEAQRFCAALDAENADCVPVVID